MKKSIKSTNYSKYNNKRVKVCGKDFDSKHEAERYLLLLSMQREGRISDLRLQVPFELIPTQREPDIIGPRGGVKPGRCIEKACVYYADFVYKDKDGNTVVEDAKSPATRTETYKIKKKLMLYLNKIKIKEV